MKIWIVIPVYNEGKRIQILLEQLKKHRCNVVVVDDGSRKPLIQKMAPRSQITYLRHMINLGKGAALKTGCDYAFSRGAEAVILMDGDGQHSPADLPKFIRILEKGKVGLVFGLRTFGLSEPLVRFLTNKAACVMVNLLFGIYVADLTSGYRAFTKEVYEKIRWESSGYAVETEIVARAGKNKLSFIGVPIETIYLDRYKGVSILDAMRIFFSVLKWRLLWR